MTNGNYDWDAFCHIGELQQSNIRVDQERLSRLLRGFSSEAGWRLCASFLLRDASFSEIYKQSTIDLPIKDFFCFRAIEEYINTGYSEETNNNNNNNKESIEQLHLFLFQWINLYVNEKSIKRENFIRNKCIQIITKVAIIDYPNRWPSFFKDLICLCNLFTKDAIQKTVTNSDTLAIEFFLKFLIYWDCEVCSRDVQTDNLIERNTLIKDWMRDHDVVNIMEIIQFIILEINMNQPSLFKKALKVASLYISWIDIRLVVTDNTIDSIIKPLAVNHHVEDNIKSASLHCLINIINKGMTVHHKLELINFIYQKLSNNGVWRWIEKAKEVPEEMGQDFDYDEDDNDNCFFVTLGSLINTIGTQLIDSYKTLKELKSDQLLICMQSIYDKMRLALNVMSCNSNIIGSTCLGFIQNFISLLKLNYKPEVKRVKRTSRTLAQLNEEEIALIDHCLTMLTHRMQFPSWYNFEKEDEAEGNFQQYRRTLLTILTNLIQLNEHIVLKFIVNLLKYTLTHIANLPFQQVEVTLKIIFNIADAIKSVKGDFFSADCEVQAYMTEMMQILVTSDLGRHQHAEVRLAYFELLLRYEKYFNHEKEYLMKVVYLFLSDSGLKSRELRVVSRCVYILSRIIKIHKSKFGDSAMTVLLEISSILQCSFSNDSFLFCDNSSTITAYSYLYESAATLLVSSDIANRQQMFHGLIEPIVAQVPNLCRQWSLSSADPAASTRLALALHSAATHINYTCKAFSGHVSMSELCCLEVYMTALDIFITNLQHAFTNSVTMNGGCPPLGRDKIAAGLRSLIHMLCKCAQHDPPSVDSVLQRLPSAIDLFLSHLSTINAQHFLPLCQELDEILSLFIQIVHVFKTQSVDFMKRSLWTLLNICDNTRKASCTIDFNNNNNNNTEDSGEHLTEQEVLEQVRQLSRLYCQLASSDITILITVLQPQELVHVLSSAIEMIHNVEKQDPLLIKLCCQLYNKLVNNYHQLKEQSLKDTILYELIYQRLLPLLIFLPSHECFNLADAQFNTALSEIATCQRSIALHGGSQFIHYLQTQCLPELRFNSDLIVQYCQALSLQEKEYQSFLKNFYIQAKRR